MYHDFQAPSGVTSSGVYDDAAEHAFGSEHYHEPGWVAGTITYADGRPTNSSGAQL